jgi:hypothetical protein
MVADITALVKKKNDASVRKKPAMGSKRKVKNIASVR